MKQEPKAFTAFTSILFVDQRGRNTNTNNYYYNIINKNNNDCCYF